MKKIFVTYLGALGDTLMITPTLRAIKETYPESKTIFLVSSKAKGIFENSPYVDELLYHKDGDSYFSVLLKIWKSDLALIYDNNARARSLAWIARIKIILGFGTYKKRFLTDYTERIDNVNIYSANNYLNLAKRIGITTNNLSMHVPTCNSEEKKEIDDLINKRCHNQKFITINPYSSFNLKDWPEEKYNDIVDKFLKYGYSTILIGGDELKEKHKSFKNGIYIPNKISPKQSAYIISRSRLFLCGCTFGLHLASTVSTPILAIYGPTSEKEWAPYDNCTVINHKLPCSPCVYIGSTFHCQLDKKCLRDITVDEVFETTINILNKENYQQNLG